MTTVLVDTSVWVAHFRESSPSLIALLAQDRVLCHPFIAGEIACGTPPQRKRVLKDVHLLRQPRLALYHEVTEFIEREQLFGLGCGWIDLNLLASTLITPQCQLWTLDKRLDTLARRFDIAFSLAKL